MLAVAAAAVVALAPVEGYLKWLHPELAKAPAAFLFAIWVLVRWRLKPAPRLHGVYVLLAAMAAVVLVSTAVHLTEPFALVYAMRWLPFLLLTAVLTDVASTHVSVRLLMASAVAGAAVASMGALYSVVIVHEFRATVPNTDPNDLACALVATLPLVLALSPRGKLGRVGVVLAGGAITLAALVTLSRGAVLALAAVVVWVLLRRAVPIRAALSVVAVAAAVGVVGAYLARAGSLAAWENKQFFAQRNVDSRLLRWQAALRMLAQQPVLGEGPGGFRSQYVGASSLGEIDMPANQIVAHSMYFEVGAELGVAGLAVLLGMIAIAFVSAETTLRLGTDRRVAVAVQASLIGNVVAVVFLSGQYFFSVWFTIAVACAIGVRVRYGDQV